MKPAQPGSDGGGDGRRHEPARHTPAPLRPRAPAPPAPRSAAVRPPACRLGPALAALLLAGCAGYQLGPTGGRPAGGQTIQVRPFENRTLEPRLSEPLTQALRKRLQQDGTYQLETRGQGDLVVEGVITEFQRSEVSFVPGDTRTPRDYQVRIVAHITVRERASGRAVLDRTVFGRTTLRVGADLTSAERQAIPLAADDLARKAASWIADGTW